MDKKHDIYSISTDIANDFKNNFDRENGVYLFFDLTPDAPNFKASDSEKRKLNEKWKNLLNDNPLFTKSIQPLKFENDKNYFYDLSVNDPILNNYVIYAKKRSDYHFIRYSEENPSQDEATIVDYLNFVKSMLEILNDLSLIILKESNFDTTLFFLRRFPSYSKIQFIEIIKDHKINLNEITLARSERGTASLYVWP